MKDIVIEKWEGRSFCRYTVHDRSREEEHIIWDHCWDTLLDYQKFGAWVKNRSAWKDMATLLQAHGYRPVIIAASKER